MENFNINIRFLEKNRIFYGLLKMNNHKNLEMKISVKIMKLTDQIISKSRNSHMNKNLTIR